LLTAVVKISLGLSDLSTALKLLQADELKEITKLYCRKESTKKDRINSLVAGAQKQSTLFGAQGSSDAILRRALDILGMVTSAFCSTRTA
jgi:hypothetical protein